MVTFLVFSIGYAFAGLSKFLPVLIPGVGPEMGRWLSVAVMIVTTAYVTTGGFSGVVLADVIQLTLSGAAGLAIGAMVYFRLDAPALARLHASFSTDMLPQQGLHFPAAYQDWNNFGSLALYLVAAGLLLNMSGAGGHYGEQRFLATRSSKDAAKAGAAWGLFSIPRWCMIVGFVYLGVSGLIASGDPETILPTVIVTLIPAGLRGLLVAALLAAFMSSFSSTVNAAASMVVCDLVQPARPDLSIKALMRVSYATTILVVVAGVAVGLHANSIRGIWVWMLAGIIGATLIPNVLRWHWWRFNGWGYAWGIFAGLGTAAAIGLAQALGAFGPGGLPEYSYAPVIWAASLGGCLAGSLLRPATPLDTLIAFYSKVRPFGFWRPVAALCPSTNHDQRLLVINLTLGVVGFVACYLTVFFLIGHYFLALLVSVLTVLACALTLRRTWYARLESHM
jgi:Na+/proline symporter